VVTQGGSPTIPVGRSSVNIGQVSATNPADACNGNPLCIQLKNTFGTALKCNATGTCNKTFIFDTTAPACSGPVAVGADFTACQVGGWRPMVGVALNPQNGPTNDLYNFQAVNYLITPSQRIQLFSNGDYNISNFARAYFQGSFVNRQSQTQLAPEPLSSAAFGGARLQADNVYNPFGATCPTCSGTGGQTVSASRRLVDAGGRSTGFDLDTVRAVAGFDGMLPEELGPLRGVFWDVSFNYGRTWGTTTYNGSVNTLFPANALGSTHPDSTSPTGQVCGTAALPIAGCVPAAGLR